MREVEEEFSQNVLHAYMTMPTDMLIIENNILKNKLIKKFKVCMPLVLINPGLRLVGPT